MQCNTRDRRSLPAGYVKVMTGTLQMESLQMHLRKDVLNTFAVKGEAFQDVALHSSSPRSYATTDYAVAKRQSAEMGVAESSSGYSWTASCSTTSHRERRLDTGGPDALPCLPEIGGGGGGGGGGGSSGWVGGCGVQWTGYGMLGKNQLVNQPTFGDDEVWASVGLNTMEFVTE